MILEVLPRVLQAAAAAGLQTVTLRSVPGCAAEPHPVATLSGGIS
jgi:hypothetical protein